MDFIDVVSLGKNYTYRNGKLTLVQANLRAIDVDTIEIEPAQPINSVILEFNEDTSGVEFQVTQLDGSLSEFVEWSDNREGSEVTGFVPAGANAVLNNPTNTSGVLWIVKRTASGEVVTEEKFGEYEYAEYQSYTVSSTDGTTWSGLIRYKRLNATQWLIETTREGEGVAPRTTSKVANDSLDSALERDYQELKTDLDNRASDLDRKLAEEQRIEDAKERVELAEGKAEELGESVTFDGDELVVAETFPVAQSFNEMAAGIPSPFSRFETDSPLDNDSYLVQSPTAKVATQLAGLRGGGNYIRLTVAPQCIVQIGMNVDGFPQEGRDLSEDYQLNMYEGDTLEIEWRGTADPPILRATIDGVERLMYNGQASGRAELAGARIKLFEARYQGTSPLTGTASTDVIVGGGDDASEPVETGGGSRVFLAILGLAGLALAYFVFVMQKRQESEE
jgi:hypothetical protein